LNARSRPAGKRVVDYPFDRFGRADNASSELPRISWPPCPFMKAPEDDWGMVEATKPRLRTDRLLAVLD